ncbi:hypothetical protein HG530_001781 [Fusarium avenaceum]|nr:hypothetical protein HG530_001781 [Fusarium avenaceum]
MKFGDLLAIQLPQADGTIVACARDICTTGVVSRNPTEGTDNVGLSQVEDSNVLVGASGHYCVIIERNDAPDRHAFVAAETELGLPFLGAPYTRLTIPTTRYQVCAVRRNVYGTDVVGMADQKALGVVGAGCLGRLDFDDGIFAARDNIAVWMIVRRWEEGKGVDIFGAAAQETCVKAWRRCLGATPYADTAIARGG